MKGQNNRALRVIRMKSIRDGCGAWNWLRKAASEKMKSSGAIRLC